MTPRRGDRIVSWRWKLRRFQARGLGKWVLVAAWVMAAVLSTVYEDVPSGYRTVVAILVGLLTFLATPLAVNPNGNENKDQRSQLRASVQARRIAAAERGRYPLRAATAPGVAAATSAKEPPHHQRTRWWSRWRRRAAPTLPPGDGLFRGREDDIQELLARHNEQREVRETRGSGHRRGDLPVATAGPVLLLIHGKAGVGKSALADELARRLALRYPHGQLFANLGTAGAARTPKDVLKDFLLALGWSEDKMPESTVERARIFRSLTQRKRMLFILDAARHADQVRHIIPSSPTATVIITSRRDLSIEPELNVGTRSYRLDVLDPDEAEEMFRAVAGLPPATRPIQVQEVLEFCDGLPAAIRSAAEWVSDDGIDVGHVAELLRPPGTRLRWLDRPGRPVASLIEAEYNRLLPEEQLAFAALGLVPSAAFVPWVLAPLLAVSQAQAEALLDRLSAVQLVDNLGRDEASGLARYRFHGLTRLLARQKAAELPETFRAEALARLDDAYGEVVASVLTYVDSHYPTPPPGQWFDDPELSQQLAAKPGPWVRYDYPMLLRVVAAAAARGDHALCWRVGSWLDGCVSVESRIDETLAAYDTALDAATKVGEELGLVDVQIAKGAFLAGIERYDDAVECLQAAIDGARELRADAGDDGHSAALLQFRAHLKLGEAYRQAALYGHAQKELERATSLQHLAGDDVLVDLGLLATEIHQVESPNLVYNPLLDGRPSSRQYRLLLSLAEAARHRRDWKRCGDHLTEALALAEGDARRTASVRYRMARVALERALDDGRADDDEQLELTAVRRAAAAVVAFEAMDNPVGAIRSRCLLARAMAAAGLTAEAERMVHEANRRLQELETRERGGAKPRGSKQSPPLVYPSLNARLRWAAGEILLMRGDVAAGQRVLIEAAALLSEQCDWSSHARIMRWLERGYTATFPDMAASS